MRKKRTSGFMATLTVGLLVGCGGGGSSSSNNSGGSVLTRGIVGAYTATRTKAVNDTLDVNYILDSTGTLVSGSLRVAPATGAVASVADFSGGSWNSATNQIAFSATVNGATYAYAGTFSAADTSQEVSTTGTLTYTPSSGTAVTEDNLQFRKFANGTLNITGSWKGTFTAPTSNGGNGTLTLVFTQGAGSGAVAGSGSLVSAATGASALNASGTVSGSLVGDRLDYGLTNSTLGIAHFTTTSLTATQIAGTYTVPQSATVTVAFGGTFALTKQN